MNKSLSIGLPSIVLLQYFTVFPEYFVSISIIYVLIVIVLVTYNVYGLMLQKALSECIALILVMTCYLILNDDLITLNFVSFHNSIMNDYLAFGTKFIICFFSAIYFLLISNSLKEQRLTSFEYLLVLLFAILGLMLMCSSNDLLTAYLSIELSSLALYILASFRKTSSYSIESGIKYFITGAVSSAFFLLGSSFLYVFSGSIHFNDFLTLYQADGAFCDMPGADIFFHTPLPVNIFYEVSTREAMLTSFYNTISQSLSPTHPYVMLIGNYLEPNHPFLQPFNTSFVEIGLALVVFSLLIKLASAPFHLWSLDVYEGSPTSSTFFFAVITKLSIFVLLTRICYVNFYSVFFECWQFYFLWVGVFSVFVGSFGGLKQRKIKTLLAYSSITNIGYGLLAFGSGVTHGFQTLIIHLFIYMLSGLATWSILLMLRLKTKKLAKKYNKELSDLALLRKSNPALALAFSLTMFSLAGIPPLIGFFAKMNVFLSLVGTTFYLFALASAAFSVIATFYYIRIIKVLYFENLIVGKLYYPIETTKTIITSILIFSLLVLFLNPSLLYLWSYQMVPVSFNMQPA